MGSVRPLLLFLSLFSATCGGAADRPAPRNVVVIGAGIGGGAFSHYWSKAHPADSILVFESRDYIGGRLKHLTMHGHVIELGGDAWSTAVNEYVVELAKEFGSQRLRPGRVPAVVLADATTSLGDPMKPSMGVWQGDHIEPMAQLLLHEPLSDLRAAIDETEFVWSLKKNYRQRGRASFFHSVEDFLAVAALDKYTGASSAEYFSARSPLSTRHISPKLLQFALEPLTRVIYDQNLSESHAFGSLVAATAAVGAASFDGGNSRLVERLFSSSGAEVRLGTRITDIGFNQESGTYTVRSCKAGAACSEDHADVVILACPIEHANISFVPALAVQPREWRHWYVTVTRARGLKPSFFGAPEGKELSFEDVLTTENSSRTIPFNVLQLEARLADGTALWKLFSNEDLSEKLSQIFDGWSEDASDTVVQYWPYTFPVLRPIRKGGAEKYQPIVLGPGLIHLNTMESVASAMEGSVIAARNAALLLTSQLGRNRSVQEDISV